MNVPWTKLVEEALDMGLEPDKALLTVILAGRLIEERGLGTVMTRRERRRAYMRRYRANLHEQRLAAA